MESLIEETPTGAKALGLLTLPRAWVPEFFSISPHLHKTWSSREHGEHLHDIVGETQRNDLQFALLRFGEPADEVSVYVRSNALIESLALRGAFRSERSDATVEGVLRAAERVYAGTPASMQGGTTGLIVQLYYPATRCGHLSNERRVAEERRRWLCETEDGRTTALRVERVKPVGDEELWCKNETELFEMLRRVGQHLLTRRHRVHLEWVWSLGRLWIVQCDDAPMEEGHSPFDVGRVRPNEINAKMLNHFRIPTSRDRRWQKIACVAVFQKLKRFTTKLFVLNDAELFEMLSTGHRSPSLHEDLVHLTRSPLVIRSDLSGNATLSAPRTDEVTDPDSALAYLIATIKWYIDNGAAFGNITFIAHAFIPAAASAFAFATPSSSRVRIDALWGLPDGLQFCTHDSYELDTRGHGKIAKKLRYKRAFLSARSHKWEVLNLGAPNDWESTLTETHLRTIADVSRRVALIVKKPVQIMWFARLVEGTGHPDPLPWRYTTEDTPTRVHSVLARHFCAPPLEIRTLADVTALEAMRRGEISSVLFRPEVGFLRNEQFLQHLGTVAAEKGLRIDLEGSPLHHTFYILSRLGAEVACIDPLDPPVERRTFQKLVRDKIPVRIQRQGELATTVRIADSELTDVLKAKLLEEALEAFHAGPDALLDELADIFEVLTALARARKWTLREVEKRAEEKRKRVGGFGKALILVETQEIPLIRPVKEGLFPGERGTARRLPSRWVVAAGRRPKTRRDRILVPLVPPPPSETRGPTRISLPFQGIVIDVRYGEKAVELVFVTSPEHVNPRQLTLDLSDPSDPSAKSSRRSR